MHPTLGMLLRCKEDRILEFTGHEPMVVWQKDQVLTIGGLVRHPGQTLEVLVDIDARNFETVPLPLLDELFEPVLTH